MAKSKTMAKRMNLRCQRNRKCGACKGSQTAAASTYYPKDMGMAQMPVGVLVTVRAGGMVRGCIGTGGMGHRFLPVWKAGGRIRAGGT